MPFLELLVPLRSFVALKARKLIAWLWRGIKYFLRHPIKSVFGLVKLWFCLMLFTVFASVVMAQEYLDSDYKPAKTIYDEVWNCSYHTNTIQALSKSECPSKLIPYVQDAIALAYSGWEISNCGLAETTGETENTWGFRISCVATLDSSTITAYRNAGATKSSDEELKVCPPDSYPTHTIGPVAKPNSNEAVWCLPELDAESDCADSVGNDPALNTITVPNSLTSGGARPKCVDNGKGKKCEVTSGVWIEGISNETHTIWSPVGGNFTGYECSEDGMNVKPPPAEDKFCSVSNSSGIYRVDCPESAIAINWNTVTGLAQASALDNQRISAIEASFLKQEDLTALVNSGQLKGEQGEKGDKGEQGIQGVAGAKGATGEKGADGKDGVDGTNGIDGTNGVDGQDGADGATGEKGADGKDGVDGLAGVDGKDGLNGKDGIDGEDGVGCSVINTPDGASIACESGTAKLENGDSCTTVQLPNGDAQISCEDGTMSEINGVDEDGIISALDTQLTEMKKQTTELEKHTESLKKLSEYDGDKPLIDYETKPDAYTEIAEFDWENNNFGTVMEEHIDAMRGLPLFSAIDNFFVTSFGGSCPVWEETVTVMDASFNVRIDQFCSSAVQNILPYIRAILMLVAGFFAWRIAIE